MTKTNKFGRVFDRMKRLVRLFIECLVQLGCIVFIMWITQANTQLPVWKFIIAGLALGIFTRVERRQWIRKSNAKNEGLDAPEKNL